MNRKERRKQQSAGGMQTAAPHPRFQQAAALMAQAAQAQQAGRLPEAESLYRRVVALDPAQADAWNQLGIVLGLQKKNADDGVGIEAFKRAVALRPGSADFINNLGIAHLDKNNLGGAQEAFEKAIRLNPFLAQAHYNLGLALRKQSKPGPAIPCFRQAIALQPHYANAYLTLGNVLSDLGECDEAVAVYRKLLSFSPQSNAIRYNIATAYKTALRFEEAAEEARQILKLDPDDAMGHSIMAQFLWSVGRMKDAEVSARRAIELDPDDVDAYTTLGAVLVGLGRFDEAQATLKKALELHPDNPGAIFRLAESSKSYSTPEFAARIESILPNERPPQQTATLHFALGKIYNDMGDYQRAFENYRAANAIADSISGFDPEKWHEFIDRIIEIFGKEYLSAPKSFASDSRRPIFIVGMPRSGTTLTEQIIASHPMVGAGGEVVVIPGFVRTMPNRLKTYTPYPECVQEMSDDMGRALIDEYLTALEKLDSESAHVTDKNPFNYKDLGFIATLFPKATLIHCYRDPMDTCLSCYFQNFSRDMGFAFSLEKLGAYYRAYRRLMDHWRKALPVSMLEVDYEELVENQEEVSRRIIAHCGLEWDDRCLQFHKTERGVRTASVWQVRQPIYKSSTRRWKNYEAFLGPLREALGEYWQEPAESS